MGGGEDGRQVRNDAEVCGLSRKIWGENQEFHVGLTELPVRPSDGQDTGSGMPDLTEVDISYQWMRSPGDRHRESKEDGPTANLSLGPIKEGLYLERRR